MSAMSSGDLLKRDLVAEALQATDVTALEGVAAEAFEVVGAEVPVLRPGGQQVVDDRQQAVGDRDRRLLLAEAAGQPAVLGRRVAAARAGGGQGAFDQGRPQVRIALARPAAEALPGALVVAGAQAGPGGAVARGREVAEVRAQLGRDDLGRPPADARDRVQAGQRLS